MMNKHTEFSLKKKSIVLLASTQDTASMNVYNQLKSTWKITEFAFESSSVFVKEFPCYFAYLCLTQKHSVHCENIDKELELALSTSLESIIFITKHDSKSGKPSFSVHTQGNWNKNELGGNPQEIATCPVILKHLLFRALQVQNNLQTEGFDVINECTHHGPSISIPSVFIEIGSTKNEWSRQDAGAVLAHSIETSLQAYGGEELPLKKKPPKTIIGFGGTHTCSNFTRLVTEDKIYLSHVCPEYALDTLEPQLILQAIQKSTRPAISVVDWKGMSSMKRQKILEFLQNLNLPYIILGDLKKELDVAKDTEPL